MTIALDDTAILATHEVSKRFGNVRALDGVNIRITAGAVHGIIGENGAGKSTLMKILSGLERPDSGHVLFHRRAVLLRHPEDAQRLGIAMIHQELNLVDDLSAADNIFLGREKVHVGLVRQRATLQAAGELLRSIHSPIDPATKVARLSIAQKQMVEIAKAISARASVLIMDEPTAVLSRHEVSALFELIDRLKRDGVAIVYISHILPEILRVCDVVTVMRDGRIVQTISRQGASELGERGLASRMVGRPMSDHFPKRLPAGDGVALQVRNLSVAGLVKDVSFEVKAGEILGFAGLIGAGRTEMAEAICGLRRKSGGDIFVHGQPVRIGKPSDAVRAGVAYLSEDRKGTGLAGDMSIAANTTMVSLRRYCRPLLNRRAEASATLSRVRELNIKIGGIHDAVRSLSGGNQQKVALAKWLETGPKVLIADEPTRGVDIGAKEQIYALLQSLTQQGMACILISSELNEVLGLSHRIAVMRAGQIVAHLDAATATEESVMHHAAGVISHTSAEAVA